MVRAYAGFRSFCEGPNIEVWLYRIPAEFPTEEITGGQPAVYAEHSSTGLRSAEVKALEALPNTEIKPALQAVPKTKAFWMVVYYSGVEGLSYRDRRDLRNADRDGCVPVAPGRRQLRGLLADVAGDRGFVRVARR
jgi:RNA polymerase sigma-70 factor, ECF subfamily